MKNVNNKQLLHTLNYYIMHTEYADKIHFS